MTASGASASMAAGVASLPSTIVAPHFMVERIAQSM